MALKKTCTQCEAEIDWTVYHGGEAIGICSCAPGKLWRMKYDGPKDWPSRQHSARQFTPTQSDLDFYATPWAREYEDCR